MIERGDQVPAAAHGVKMLPPKSWSREQASEAAAALLKWAKTVPTSQRTGEEYVQTTQLAGDLANLMPADQAVELRKQLKEMRVAVFVLSTVREQMRYDSARLVVEAGKPFEIILENTDFMPHNLAIVKPGSREKIGAAVLTMRPDEFDSQGRSYIPPGDDILAATKLVESGQKTRLRFTAPSEEGNLEYVCTFPGHWEAMWGKMVVTKDVDAYLQAHPDAGPTPAPTGAAGHEHHH
jgi:azurin